jgi:hypothetical protein
MAVQVIYGIICRLVRRVWWSVTRPRRGKAGSDKSILLMSKSVVPAELTTWAMYPSAGLQVLRGIFFDDAHFIIL